MYINMFVCLSDVIDTFLPYNVHYMQIRKYANWLMKS